MNKLKKNLFFINKVLVLQLKDLVEHASKKIKLHSKRGMKRKQLKDPLGHESKKLKWEMLR